MRWVSDPEAGRHPLLPLACAVWLWAGGSPRLAASSGSCFLSLGREQAAASEVGQPGLEPVQMQAWREALVHDCQAGEAGGVLGGVCGSWLLSGPEDSRRSLS